MTASTGKRKTRGVVVHTIGSLMARTEEVGDCREWTGCLQNGVPFVTSSGKRWLVRRLILSLQGREIAADQYAVPRCGNPLCVNPMHIQVRSEKLHLKKCGETPPRSIRQKSIKLAEYSRKHRSHLTMEVAREIRLSPLSGPELAKAYDCCRSTVSKIRRGQSWAEHTGVFGGLGAR